MRLVRIGKGKKLCIWKENMMLSMTAAYLFLYYRFLLDLPQRCPGSGGQGYQHCIGMTKICGQELMLVCQEISSVLEEP